jgi:diacylglycerol kinase (ATP)
MPLFGSMSNPVVHPPTASRECPALVFVNPTAGGGRAKAYLQRIQRLFERLGFPARFLITESEEELASRARRAIANQQKILFAMGGDGTFQGLANATYGAGAVLGVLPAGGGNDFAAALGLPSDPVVAAEMLVGGQPRDVDLIRATTSDGRQRLYVGGGGIGLDAEAARYASGACRRFPGRFRYIASALRALVRYKSLDVQVDFPESGFSPVELRALLAGVLNTPTYGGGLRFAPKADIEDGLLDVVLIEHLRLFGVLVLLPRLMSSGELRTSRVKRWRVERVRLTTNPPSLFHGDGEILGPTPVEIEVEPKAIRVLLPLPR